MKKVDLVDLFLVASFLEVGFDKEWGWRKIEKELSAKSKKLKRKSSNEKFVDQEKFAQILILKSSAVIEKFHLILKASPLLEKVGSAKVKSPLIF